MDWNYAYERLNPYEQESSMTDDEMKLWEEMEESKLWEAYNNVD